MLRPQAWRVLATLACGAWLSGCSAGTPGSKTSGSLAVRLAPDPVIAASSITAVLSDPFLDVSTCRFEWRRNGAPIADAAGPVLAPAGVTKGDEIAVTVHVPDAGGADRTATARVKVVNSPPAITRVTLSMNAVGSAAELQASVQCVDPDGDTPAFAYRWLQNGQPIAGATGASLPAASFTRGDPVAVEVVASDGESESPPSRSEPYAVDNQPPQFSSQPTPPKAGDTEFSYRPQASDPDGDPLRYELISGPLGMSVDSQGRLLWRLPAEGRQGDYAVRLRAVDPNGGEAVQEFTLRLEALKPPKDQKAAAQKPGP